jgi:hypothetical protein
MGKDKPRPWRWSEQEFYERLDDYLEKRIEWMSKHIEELNCSNTGRLNMKIAISEYHRTEYPPNKRIAGCRALGLNVRDWSRISLDPNTSLEKLMLLYIAGELYNEPLICIAFMCKNPKITEEFIEDAMYIGSGLFAFDEWDKAPAVIDYIDKGEYDNSKESKELLALYDEERIPVHVKDRIDWKNINFRKYSKDFIHRHKLLIERCYKYSHIEKE